MAFTNLFSPFTNLFKRPTLPSFGSQRASLVNPAGAFSQAPQISIPKPQKTASPFGFASPQIPPPIPGVNFTPYRSPYQSYAPNITSAVTKKPAYATPSGAIVDPATGELISAPPIPQAIPGVNFTPYRPPTTQPAQGTDTINQNLPQGASSAIPPPVLPPSPPLPPETPPETPPEQVPQPSPTPGPVPLTKQEKAVADAESLYQKASEINPEELSTQEDVDKLIEQARKIQQSFRLGYQNIQDQPIAMEFITGQQRSLENRLTNTLTGLETTAEPLERKLARMQAKRTAALEASKFGLERADKAAEALKPIAGTSFYDPKTGKFITAPEKAKATEAFTLSPGEVRYDEKGNVVATGPAKETPSTAGFSLSPGERRYDAQGNLIAQGGPKEPSQAAETKAIEKTEKAEAAQQQAGQSIGLVNNLLANDNYKAVSGLFQSGGIPFFGNPLAKNQYEQLTGMLKLGIRGLIKGQGQVSDYEGRILAQASADVGRNLGERQMKEALLKIRGVLKTNSGQTTEVIIYDPSGKSLGKGELTGDEIYQAVSDGNRVEYL